MQAALTSLGIKVLNKSFRSGMLNILAANISMPVDRTRIDLWHAEGNIPDKH